MNQPSHSRSMDTFWRQARASCSQLPQHYSSRQIGLQPELNSVILRLIASGNKTGTVSIPEVDTQTGRERPAVGDGILLLDANAEPAIAVQLVKIEHVPYGKITEQHTKIDGPRVRQLKVWQDSHLPWFNRQLAPFGLSCTASTLISFETFAVRYPALNLEHTPNADKP